LTNFYHDMIQLF